MKTCGRLLRQFVEQLLMMAAESVAGPKHPGRVGGEVRWHGRQGGVVNLGTCKLKVTRPRLRATAGEIALPGYAALASDGDLSRRIADVLTCNVSTRKYARVMYRCADEMGISRSAVSRHFIKDSAQALAKLMSRDFATTDLVAIYVDGIIIARHHVIAAIGVDASGQKHMLGIAEVLSPLRDIDKWVRRKLRCYIWKQWGRAGYRNLRKRGVSVREAWNTSKSAHGPWRLSKTPALALALPVRYFSSMGLPALAAR